MDGVKMTHRARPTALPSIHRGTGVPKLASEYTNDTPQLSQSRPNFASAKSFDATCGRLSNADASSIEALLPHVGDDEQIDMGRIKIERRSHKYLLPPSIRHMAGSKRSGQSAAQSYVSATFDPLPFQTQYFKSSTMLKMVPVLRRHQDMFVEKTHLIPREKPLIMHSERYQYSEPLKPGFERLGQRERLLAEREYIHRLKQQKLARETLPHRESKDLLMGGHRASFNERFDVRDELRRLKAIVLPVNARELYHGKGIILPPTHSSIKPRTVMPPPLPIVRSHTLPMNQESTNNPGLSRRSTESNFMTLPEDGDFLPEFSRSPGPEGEGNFFRAVSTDNPLHSAIQRAESEMDIIIPPEAESAATKPRKANTPIKAPTPNPLRAADLTLYHVEEEEMKAMFQKLDTDEDGHLMYQQVEPQFPQTLLPNQKRYLKQIYDITSASTYFGMKEFVTLKCLCEEVVRLDHELMLRGFEHLNFSTLTTSVIQYTELFQQVDRTARGRINLESLQDILCSALRKDKDQLEYGLSELKNVLKIENNDVNKVKFIAGIPYYLTVASLEKPAAEEMNVGEEKGTPVES